MHTPTPPPNIYTSCPFLPSTTPSPSLSFLFFPPQIPHMRHENLQGFIAADIIQKSSQMQHYLITEYQEQGTLHHYLQTTVLDVFSMVMMAHSIACGLAYLHTEVNDNYGTKPAIAHRSLTSRSVYVKDDGEFVCVWGGGGGGMYESTSVQFDLHQADCSLNFQSHQWLLHALIFMVTSAAGTCCIADLSLAVKDDNNLTSELKSQPWGSPRYLAPEFLAECSDSQYDIDALRRGDMYSYGLVLWELARRCATQGKIPRAV